MQSLERELEHPRVFQDLDLVLFLIGTAIESSDVPDPHILRSNSLGVLELQSSLYHHVKVAAPVHFLAICFQRPPLAATIH